MNALAPRLRSIPMDGRMQCRKCARQIFAFIFCTLDILRVGPLLVVIGGLCYSALTLVAQTVEYTTADAPPHESWAATSDLKSENVSAKRVIESHSQNGNRTLDKQLIQIPGPGGQFEYYEEIEKETVKLDANTVRITERTFGRNGNGEKNLVLLAEEKTHTLPGGDSTVLRAISIPDLNGTLQLVRRDILETKRVDKNIEETNTTVMLPNVNSGFEPAVKVHEVRKKSGSDTVEIQKTIMVPDGSGNWQVTEFQEHTARQDTRTRSSDERVFRRDFEGKLGEVSRVVSQESNSDSGEKHTTVETYSIDVPGTARDGSLHLVERKTTSENSSSTGERSTEQKVEKINPGDAGAGLRVSTLVNGKIVPGPAGEESTVTIRARDLNGSFATVAVDTTKSDRIPTIQIQQTPSVQPK